MALLYQLNLVSTPMQNTTSLSLRFLLSAPQNKVINMSLKIINYEHLSQKVQKGESQPLIPSKVLSIAIS